MNTGNVHKIVLLFSAVPENRSKIIGILGKFHISLRMRKGEMCDLMKLGFRQVLLMKYG